MKKIALFIAVMLSAATMMAQQMIETVHLKNGGLVKGEIIEQVPGESLKVRTKDGNVFVYQMDEVEKITKETNTETQATGHRGLDFNVDLGYDIATKGGGGSLAAELELGKRFNKNFYWGIGSGVYIPSGDGDLSIPITTDFKVYMPLNNSKIAPFLGLKAGYVINTGEYDAVSISSKGKIHTETKSLPNNIMIEIMPGVQIPLSNSVDFNFGAGYAHFIPTDGDFGSSGAIAIRAGFGFHKGNTPKIHKPRVPTRDKGFQLTLEADAISPWNLPDNYGEPGYGAIGAVGANIVLGYKLNPNISVGIGYGGSYLNANAALEWARYYEYWEYKDTENGREQVVTGREEYYREKVDDGSDGGAGYAHKFFIRGQYRFNDNRFSPIVNVDLGFRKYLDEFEDDFYDTVRSYSGEYSSDYDDKYKLNSSTFFISPSIGFSLRTTNNSYFEMKLGYSIGSNLDGKVVESMGSSKGNMREVYVYEQKPVSTSGAFLTIGWTHTFGSRK